MPSSPVAQDSSVCSVLVVDDDQLMTELLSILLRDLSISDIRVAEDGQQALATLAQYQSDVMICDLKMPGMDGTVLMKHLANMPSPPTLILLSGEDPRVLEASRHLAATRGLSVLGALQKPVDRSQLAKLLFNWSPSAPREDKQRPRLDETGLRTGLATGAYWLAYQPKLDLQSGEMVGAEALLRWHDSEAGEIAPDQVVRAAELHDCIDELTLCVLRQAVMDRAKLAAAGIFLNIAINVSLRNLNDAQMVERIVDTVVAKGEDPVNFTLEITETHQVNDLATTLEMLIRLRMNGFRIALDDYGTGASTMQLLQQFPSTEMKIDGSFVAAAPSSDQDRAFLSTAIELGTKLGQVIVAEGIETKAQWALAIKLGCHLGQGYYFSKPLPLDSLISWTKSRVLPLPLG